MSQLEVDKVIPQSGTTLTLGESGDTITVPSGATLSSTDPLVFPAGTVSAPAITTTGDTNTGIFFPAADEIAFTEGGAEAMRINSDGNLALAKNIGLGGATPTTSGTGITFPATASASTNANTLDDYEEGTWTPIIFGTTTAGTGTYIVQGAVYTKIGKTVSVAGFVGWSAHTGTGNMKMGGLPFTTLNNSNTNSCFALSEIGNITTSASNILTLQVIHNTTDAQFLQTPVGGGLDAAVTLDVAGYFRFSTTYFV